ncbi:MAG: hypothetical protein RLZZ387_4647 [Chloroflexota bacterium]|jgi:cell division septum initiation protein DivIVA
MTIYWSHTDSDSVADAMAAAERALAGDTPPEPGAAAGVDPRVMEIVRGDPYLAENIVVAHASWGVDQGAIVVSRRPGLAWAINRFQWLVRRATWWYTAPQLDQINMFHGAVVRVLASLVKNQHALEQRVAESAGGHVLSRTALLEQQIVALREEQRSLQQRVAELEERLAPPRHSINGD